MRGLAVPALGDAIGNFSTTFSTDAVENAKPLRREVLHLSRAAEPVGLWSWASGTI